VKRISAWLGLLLAIAGLAAPRTAFAWELAGEVRDGTRGRPAPRVPVELVDPSGGMAARARDTTDARGRFRFAFEGPPPRFVLLRARYRGVSYFEPVRVDAVEGPVTMSVYDTSGTWHGVHLSVPHVFVRRTTEGFAFETMWELHNETDPPVTLTGPSARFRFALPPGRSHFGPLYVAVMGVPVEKEPLPTDLPDRFEVDYPIRPGVTRIAYAFDLPEKAGRATLRQVFLEPTRLFRMLVEDSSIVVLSDGPEGKALEGEPIENGLRSFELGPFSAGDTLSLVFVGGEVHEPRHTHEVIVLPPGGATASTILVALFGTAILAILFFADRWTPAPDRVQEALRAERDRWIARIAALDELFEGGGLSETLYREIRREWKARLLEIEDLSERSRSDSPRGS
jgi:hypothetical protein